MNHARFFGFSLSFTSEPQFSGLCMIHAESQSQANWDALYGFDLLFVVFPGVIFTILQALNKPPSPPERQPRLCMSKYGVCFKKEENGEKNILMTKTKATQ